MRTLAAGAKLNKRRVFDIRPQKDGDVLRCMHGIAGTKLLVGDFFAKMRDLLAASPSEFAIVTTKIDTSAGEPEVPVWAPLFSSLIQRVLLQFS